MIGGEFVQALKGALEAPRVVKVNGIERLAVPKETGWALESLPLPATAAPDSFQLATLAGLVGYIKENRDGLKLESCTVHVAGPGTVRLSEPLTGDYFRNRYVLALAQLDERTGFSFGHWQVLEDFIIGLQVHFVHTDARAAVLKLLGNVKDEAVQTSQDDGVTQTVQAKRGAVLADNVPVPNPVVLAPFRTFREVEQPSSAFILRLKTGGPSAALFEADGGAWRLEAVRRVSTWLQEQLAGTGVAIIA